VLAGPSVDERIRLRAFDLYQRRGVDGHVLDDWLAAESELRAGAWSGRYGDRDMRLEQVSPVGQGRWAVG